MSLPSGTLVLSRVVGDPGDALATALDRGLTGYAVLEPQDALLLDGTGEGRLTFEDGVPVTAGHTGTGRRGADALADLAVPGPYRVELRSVSAGALEAYHREADRRVAADAPADLLAGDAALADRTRAAAPTSRRDETADAGSMDAVEAFLDDEEKIDAIRERAREEARERAEQWGFDETLE